MFKRIVVPLDGSQSATAAFEVAVGLAKTEHAELAICSIVDPIVIAGTTPPSPALDLVLQDMENKACSLVQHAVDLARAAGVKARGEALLGLPFDEILRFAKREKADAVVMGTHGRTGVKRLLMGSVAESVLRDSHCPVIVVREGAALPAHATAN